MATVDRITGAQVRMARAFLNWTIAELAEKSDTSAPTVRAIEESDGAPGADAGGLETTRDYREGKRAESVAKVAKALTAAGITFLPDDGNGVGVRGKAKRKAKG